MTTERFHTLCEAAALLGVSTKTIRRRIHDGSLRKVNLGGRLVRIPASEIVRISLGEPINYDQDERSQIRELSEHCEDIPK